MGHRRLSMPAIITRRAALVTGAAALAMMPRDAHAVATTLSTANADGASEFVVAPGGLSAERCMWWTRFAVDGANDKLWVYNNTTDQWNGQAIGSQDPAGGVGGIDISYISSTYFPAWSCAVSGSTESIRLVSNPANFLGAVPSGFTALDTAIGSAVTWNPSDKNASMALSESNVRATNNAGAWASLRATAAIPSSKVYYETQNFTVATSGQHMTGMMNSTASLSNYPGSDNHGISWYMSPGWGSFFKNGSSGYGSVTPGAWTVNEKRLLRAAVNSKSTGKWFVEWQMIDANTSDFTGFGFAPASAAVNLELGSAGGSYGYSNNGGLNCNGSSVGSGVTFTTGAYVVTVIDLSALQVWNYIAAGWNGGKDPTVGNAGYSVSALTTPVFPALSSGSGNGQRLAMNCAGPFNFSSIASSLQAAGYAPWDGSGGGPRSRGFIFGQNSPARDALRALRGVT